MKKTERTIAFALMLSFTLGVAGADALYGNAAAKADTSLTIQDMLLYAAQDEYAARGEYAAIMDKYGTLRPFSNIIRAEENHLAWLRDAFAAYKLPFPADEAASRLAMPTSLADAYKTGVQAELDNIAMYKAFLANPLIQGTQYGDLRALFSNLMNASENHLRAFQNQLTRY